MEGLRLEEGCCCCEREKWFASEREAVAGMLVENEAAEAGTAPAAHSAAECMMAPFAVQLRTMQVIRKDMLNTEAIALDLVEHWARLLGPLAEQ